MRCTKNFLLAGFLSIAQANDIIFYPNPACSEGNFNGCFNIDANACCAGSGTDTFAISISKGPNDFATMFGGGGCTTPLCVRTTCSRVLSLQSTDLFFSWHRVLVPPAFFAVWVVTVVSREADGQPSYISSAMSRHPLQRIASTWTFLAMLSAPAPAFGRFTPTTWRKIILLSNCTKSSKRLYLTMRKWHGYKLMMQPIKLSCMTDR